MSFFKEVEREQIVGTRAMSLSGNLFFFPIYVEKISERISYGEEGGDLENSLVSFSEDDSAQEFVSVEHVAGVPKPFVTYKTKTIKKYDNTISAEEIGEDRSHIIYKLFSTYSPVSVLYGSHMALLQSPVVPSVIVQKASYVKEMEFNENVESVISGSFLKMDSVKTLNTITTFSV